MEEKELLEKVALLFKRFGIKSMTMDEIARQLGISKKTLYQFVSNKNELVIKMMHFYTTREQDCIDDVFRASHNAIDELMETTKLVGSQVKEMHQSVMFDLNKYHPEAFKILRDHKDQFIYRNIKRNLETGMEEGLYRENLKPELISRLYLSMVHSIMEPENFNSTEFSYADLHLEMMRYHIRGIASAKGRDYLKQKFKKENV